MCASSLPIRIRCRNGGPLTHVIPDATSRASKAYRLLLPPGDLKAMIVEAEAAALDSDETMLPAERDLVRVDLRAVSAARTGCTGEWRGLRAGLHPAGMLLGIRPAAASRPWHRHRMAVMVLYCRC